MSQQHNGSHCHHHYDDSTVERLISGGHLVDGDRGDQEAIELALRAALNKVITVPSASAIAELFRTGAEG